MNREECEAILLEKIEELINIAKEYDKSEDFYLSATVINGYISINNASWETETPINAYLANGRREQVDFN